MSEAGWVTCPHCALKQRRRPDGKCPKCRQGVEGVPADAAAPVASGSSSATGALTVCNMDQGRVVITDDAILDVRFKGKGEGERIGVAGGGAVGGLVGFYVDQALEKRALAKAGAPAPPPAIASLATLERPCLSSVAGLPAGVGAHRDFPRVAPDCKVRVFPRSSITSARLSIWNGLHLTVSPAAADPALGITAAGEAKVNLAAWHIGKVRDHLARAGYPLVS